MSDRGDSMSVVPDRIAPALMMRLADAVCTELLLALEATGAIETVPENLIRHPLPITD